MEPCSETSCHRCARGSPMEPFSCSVLSFPAYIDSRSLLPRMPDATHATPGHPEARPLCRSGVFLFHRGLPFHQSCFTLIAPNFILCPQLVRTGGRRDTTIRNTMLYHTTLCYAILYDTIMLYHIEVGLPISQHSGHQCYKSFDPFQCLVFRSRGVN